MGLSSDMFRGHTETMILNILIDGDNYGYEITKRIKNNSEGQFDIKDATIYTAFRRMESDGLITTYWGDGVGGARRRYYSITESGRAFYEDKVREWIRARDLLNGLLGCEE